MTVPADSSVLNYLILIDAVQVLPQIFGEVLIPEAVCSELQRSRTPSKVATWISERPNWLRVHKPTASQSESITSGHASFMAARNSN